MATSHQSLGQVEKLGLAASPGALGIEMKNAQRR
jgi:hypothetical protein